MSSSHSTWQPWQMATLERRTPQRARQKPENSAESQNTATQASGQTRRREDQISITLFNIAKEEAEKKGFEKGHAEGLKQGRADGEKAVRAEHEQQLQEALTTAVQPIEELAATFRQAVEGLDEEVSHALVDLALDIGQRLAGHALELKPEHILDDVEDLLEANPTLGGSPTLYVSVDDLSLVETHLQQTLDAAGWHIRADMGLARGDCRIETEHGEIDATNTDRWERLLHAVGHEEH